MILLIDERPEEVTDMARSVNAWGNLSTFDGGLADKTRESSNIVLEKQSACGSRSECGDPYWILSPDLQEHIIRVVPSSGKDSFPVVWMLNALHKPKRFFGCQPRLNVEHWAAHDQSLPLALWKTGSKMDEVNIRRIKGTGNMELALDRSFPTEEFSCNRCA